jgi:hypothetical protein
MMCHKIGCEPTGIIGLGMLSEYSRIRVPRPPQKSTTFIWQHSHGVLGAFDHRAIEESRE